MKLYETGVLEKHNVKMIGADHNAIKKAEDRECFKKAMLKIGLDLPRSGMAYNMEEAKAAMKKIGGGGHRPVGGATVKKEDAEAIAKRLIDGINGECG